jgi:hypothetical protein
MESNKTEFHRVVDELVEEGGNESFERVADEHELEEVVRADLGVVVVVVVVDDDAAVFIVVVVVGAVVDADVDGEPGQHEVVQVAVLQQLQKGLIDQFFKPIEQLFILCIILFYFIILYFLLFYFIYIMYYFQSRHNFFDICFTYVCKCIHFLRMHIMQATNNWTEMHQIVGSNLAYVHHGGVRTDDLLFTRRVQCH